MSRTIRRGKPSRNYHHYIKIGKLIHENQNVTNCYWGGYTFPNRVYYRLWKTNEDDSTTYEEYATKEIRDYHREKYQYSCPRYIRMKDVQNQKRQHKEAIRKGLASGDFDVVLETMDKFNSYYWW